MKRTLMTVLMTGVMLAACAKKEEASSPGVSADNALTETASASIAAAPGIALRYAYRVRLPAERIGRVQEEHAAACEAIGPARCRILGLHYNVGASADQVDATLDLLLDASIARKFGSDGIAAVVKAGGKLGTTDITGTDAGSAIKALDAQSHRAEDSIASLEAKLRNLPPNARERGEIERQIAARREQIETNASQRDDQASSLAVTPMHFDYDPMASIVGIDAGSTIGQGLWLGLTSFNAALAVLVVVAAVGIPWALFAFGAWALFRVLRRRLAPAVE